jgi:uroporphyrinogen decarboxylase
MENVREKDTMTPCERLQAYGRGDSVDRLPCVPIVGNTAARVLGVKVSEFRGNGRLIAEAQIASYRRFGYDGIRVFTDLYQQAEAMGATICYPDDETAYLKTPAISEISQIDSLEPADPRRDGNLPHHLEAMKRVTEAVGEDVPVTGAITGPFTNATFLVGTDRLMRMIIEEPEAVHRLCELSLQTALAYAEAILEVGCTPSLTDPMSSCSVVGPKQFREFGYPYLKRLVDHVHGRGRPVTLHICGNTRKIWDLMADTGADCLSLDNDVDLSAAVKKIGQRTRIMGNIHPAETMLLGCPAQVRRATRECVAQAYGNPKGYIVASGCSLPTDTPFENIDAMLDAVREIGYPVDPEALALEMRP